MIKYHYNIKRFLDFPRGEYEARYTKLQNLMAGCDIDVLLVTNEPNVRYFTGLNTRLYKTVLRPIIALLPAAREREPILVVPEVLEATCLATTWVEDIRTNSECYGKQSNDVLDVLAGTIEELGLANGTMGMEFGAGQRLALTHGELEALQSKLPKVNWTDATDLIWNLQMIKSSLEVEALQIACDISAVGIEAGFKALKPGMTERELYGVITSTYYKEGAEDHFLVFMSGAKGYQTRDAGASDHPFERGHFAKVDGGAIYKGYHTDFCRHIAMGPLLESQRNGMRASAQAGAAAIQAMRPGVPINELGTAADRVLTRAGYQFYMNSIGHGVGLHLHEPPWLDRANEKPIQEGMVLAIEVGVVDADRFDDGSYTFEENVLVTEEGGCVLTDKLPPEILESS